MYKDGDFLLPCSVSDVGTIYSGTCVAMSCGNVLFFNSALPLSSLPIPSKGPSSLE